MRSARSIAAVRGATGRRRAGLAVATIAISLALVSQTGITSNASWNDSEWGHGSVGASSCATPAGAFANRGEGRAVGGSLLGIDLGGVANVHGVRATHDGARPAHSPAGAASAGADNAWADTLNVTALQGAIDAELSDAVKLPLGTGTGAVNQYAQAAETGTAVGASGWVMDDGGINLSGGSGYPEIATFGLSTLLARLDPAVSSALGGVADLSLEVGAVAGRASLDGCDAAWNGPIPYDPIAGTGNLHRDYLASHLRASLESQAAGTLYDATLDLIGGLQGRVNQLLAQGGVVDSITSGLLGEVQRLLNGSLILKLDTSPPHSNGSLVTVTAQVDTTNLMLLANAPFGDDDGIVTIDLPNDGIEIDLARLVGKAFHDDPGVGLNELAPNTAPLTDPRVTAALATAVSNALDDWLDRLGGVLNSTIDSISVNVVADVYLQAVLLFIFVPIGGVHITVSGTLKQVLEGTASKSVALNLLPGLGLIPGAVNTLLGTLVNGLTNSVLGIVGTAFTGVFDALRVVPAAVTGAASALAQFIPALYGALFLQGVVSLVVNAQSDIAPPGHAEPPDWGGLPPGQYDVAALRIGVLEAVADGARVYLGRGSVGRVCSIAQTAAGECPGY